MLVVEGSISMSVCTLDPHALIVQGALPAKELFDMTLASGYLQLAHKQAALNDAALLQAPAVGFTETELTGSTSLGAQTSHADPAPSHAEHEKVTQASGK